jgi:hypothetical protein
VAAAGPLRARGRRVECGRVVSAAATRFAPELPYWSRVRRPFAQRDDVPGGTRWRCALPEGLLQRSERGRGSRPACRLSTCTDCLAGVRIVATAASDIRVSEGRYDPHALDSYATWRLRGGRGEGQCGLWRRIGLLPLLGGRRLAGLDGPSTTSGLGGVRPDTQRVGCLSLL